MTNAVFTIIDKLVSSGKIFSANFTKADGTLRTMNCRVGVQKNLKGVGIKPTTLSYSICLQTATELLKLIDSTGYK